MSYALTDNKSHSAAFVFRTTALLILLYQIRLLAADLSDTPFFIATMIGALAAAFFLKGYKYKGRAFRPPEALAILALTPWVIRFFIALPRWFFPNVSSATILLDSLLLNLDRNNFSSLLPFYWLAISTYFSLRSRPFLRADIIVADTFFLVLFSIVPSSSMNAFRWPILMVGFFALVFFLQILALIFSMPPELKLEAKESVFAGCFLFLLILASAIFFIGPFQKRAVERGGGLLEPRLFRFDFSQILRLESEISLNDDLVLIVKKDRDDYHNLLRRYTLSGYNPRQGFSRLEGIDEDAHPQNLPNRRWQLPTKEIKNFRLTEQEYYIVNFDAFAFIGMNMPVEIIPFESWDASSFNSAYAVKSLTSEALPYELIDAVKDKPDPQNLDLSPEEYALYTEYGRDDAIASFAREIIQGSSSRLRMMQEGQYPSYWEQVQMIYDRLKFGEFRYSLKPGIAPDGDQLKHFLFNSKKGYCTYYAFAFTLMLRSLGIPSRVAAGFFVDPFTVAFNSYYPVRADMAHAWVEVWFPGYGWIEYDPTTGTMAEGEEFRFSKGTAPELFERLMKEILENRSRLKVKDGDGTGLAKGNIAALGEKALAFFAGSGPFAAFVIFFLSLRNGFLWLYCIRKRPAKKALYLWAHAKRRLALAGLGRQRSQAEADWAKVNDQHIEGLYSLYLDVAAARFAPEFTLEDGRNMAEHYRLFSGGYRRAIPPRRRVLAWFLPPLALILGPASNLPRKGSGAAKTMLTILMFFFVFSLAPDTGAQDDQAPWDPSSDLLYENAMASQRAENWERAVELFTVGIDSYPKDFRFPWSLGNLYYNRRFFHLAWDEYRRAEEIILNPSTPPNPHLSWDLNNSLYLQLSNTAGYLNKNEASASYLEALLLRDRNNREAVSSLAWMYFKLHRLEEGEKLILDVIDQMGEDMDFAMTLGAIYSGLFRYKESKEAYQRVIREAEAIGDRLFACLSYYNLSILESRFYQFGLAYDCTSASLEAMNRASSRLARGELHLRRMELPRVLEDYQAAYSIDSSPLSKLSLAQAFQIGGRLKEAVLYANDCLKAQDQSWMLNYGIDPIRYKRDIHEILKNSYNGLLSAESLYQPVNLLDWVQGLSVKIPYRFLAAVHKHLYRKYSLFAAKAYDPSGPWNASFFKNGDRIHSDALIQYNNAFNAYPRRAMTYLRQARNFEAPLIPASVHLYNLEEGRLLKNRRILNESLAAFDPLWERDKIAEAYVELAFRGAKAERQDAAERLFAINRAALPQNGIKLPVELQIGIGARSIEGALRKACKAAGLEAAILNSPRFTLTIDSYGGGLSCELYDNGRGTSVWELNMPLSPSDRGFIKGPQRAAFARTLRDGIFDAF